MKHRPEVTRLLAIDPGDVHSSAVLFDSEAWKPIDFFGEMPNDQMRTLIRSLDYELILIEYTPPYTMSTAGGHNYVPKQVVDTAIEAGRFIEAALPRDHELISRSEVKRHLLGRTNGNDTAVKAAVADAFGTTTKRAKGTKANPGPLRGISGSHLYSALAVAVTYCQVSAMQVGRMERNCFDPLPERKNERDVPNTSLASSNRLQRRAVF